MQSLLVGLRHGLKEGSDPLALTRRLPWREFEVLDRIWALDARPDQKPPEGDWLTWLILGGRGAGKTRAGAEWVRAIATRLPKLTGPIALVGETFTDTREVMIEGVSGLLAIHPSCERPEWQRTRRRLVWPNGAVAQAFSAEDPEALRGPQFAAAWADAALPARSATGRAGSYRRSSCPRAASASPAPSSGGGADEAFPLSFQHLRRYSGRVHLKAVMPAPCWQGYPGGSSSAWQWFRP